MDRLEFVYYHLYFHVSIIYLSYIIHVYPLIATFDPYVASYVHSNYYYPFITV